MSVDVEDVCFKNPNYTGPSTDNEGERKPKVFTLSLHNHAMTIEGRKIELHPSKLILLIYYILLIVVCINVLINGEPGFALFWALLLTIEASAVYQDHRPLILVFMFVQIFTIILLVLGTIFLTAGLMAQDHPDFLRHPPPPHMKEPPMPPPPRIMEQGSTFWAVVGIVGLLVEIHKMYLLNRVYQLAKPPSQNEEEPPSQQSTPGYNNTNNNQF